MRKIVAFTDMEHLMYIQLPEGDILIGNYMKWIEDSLPTNFTHETIHKVICDLVDEETSEKFDNLFGLLDRSVLLVPDDEVTYNSVMRFRIEKWWIHSGGRRK